VSRPPWEAVRLDDLDRVDVAGVQWRPLRRRLGITAFGTNAYTADAGEQVVEPHHEEGQEELYVVLRGHARFVLDGEEVDAPQGTVVFCGDGTVRREAVALEDGTAVMAVGGVPGAAGSPSAWEWRFLAAPLLRAGRLDEAEALLREGLEVHPQDGATHYDLACVHARRGDLGAARAALARAAELRPETASWARDDEDLTALR
jgi:mannose-6-phosphate isomerase-like protein (cupin superfamily)